MNIKLIRTLLFVSVALVALFAAARQFGKSSPAASLSNTHVEAAAPAETGRVAMEAMPGQFAGETLALVKVYQSPDGSSRVKNILTPAQPVRILGRSADGAFYAIGGSGNGEEAAGWISTADVNVEKVGGMTRTLAKIYQEPDSESQMVDLWTPAQAIQILGRSADGAWYAVADPRQVQGVAGWLSSADVELDATSAVTQSLTKLYRQPDFGSEVIDVLTPAHPVILLGRSSGGGWYAVASEERREFKGWALASDLNPPGGAGNLPVLAR